MSSGSTEQSPQDEPASEKRASGASENDAEGLARATECPSCGTTFASDYCPSCGQAADPSVSATAVIGGFFRELVDVENGFWPTLVRLTLHPGKTLRRYLDGARGSLVSPGRYLLASVIISFSASWILLRTGALQVPTPPSSSDSSEVPARALGIFAEIAQQSLQSQWIQIGLTLVAVGLFASVLRRLLGEELTTWGRALAGSAFLIGHATVLGTAVLLASVPLLFLLKGEPVAVVTQSAVSLLVTTVYVGTALHSFRPAWKNTAKATLGILWVQVETVGTLTVVAAGYAFWKIVSSGTLSFSGAVLLGTVGALYALPLLVHAGVEAYYRLQ